MAWFLGRAVLIIIVITSFYSDISEAECGQPHFKPQLEARSRVVNGANAVPHSWPWTVWVTYSNSNGMGFTCGGTLVGTAENTNETDIVITASHCVVDKQNRDLNPKGFRIFVGNHDVRQKEVAEVQSSVSKLTHHSSYRPITNDIAMLRLSAPVKYNNYVQPACLPTQGQTPSDPNNCYVAGWGRMFNQNQATAKVLQQARLPILSDDTCRRTWGNLFDSKTMTCAGFLNGAKNACNGDSGGPLVCQENGRWTLFGAVSYGNAGACAVANKPGVFARVSNYRNWIDQQVAKLKS